MFLNFVRWDKRKGLPEHLDEIHLRLTRMAVSTHMVMSVI